MTRSHTWRPMVNARKDTDGPCQYLNCRRPRGAHERAVSQVSRWRR